MSDRPRPSVGLPLPPPREPGLLAAHRGKLAAGLVVLGLGLLALRGPSVEELARRWGYGTGYVPWFDLEWKARQTASAAKKPLLVYRVDPRHPAAGRLATLLGDDAVQARVERVVWLRREEPAPAADPPAAPALLLYGSNTETLLVERADAHTLAAEELARLLDEAVAANARQGER